MDWTTIAILSAATFSIVNIIDSHLLTKRMPSFRAFILMVSVLHMTYAIVALNVFPLPEDLGTWPLLATLFSGLLRAASITIMLYILRSTEVSQVIPVIYIYPIFVALAAGILLGESLHPLQWLAVVIVVAGAVMVSVNKSPAGKTRWPGKIFLLLIVASLCMAGGDITSKYALEYISFWNNFSVAAICMAAAFLVMSLRPGVIREIARMERKKSTLPLMLINEAMAPVAILLSFWAIQMGPVSLVSAVIGSRPVFVTIFSLVLGRVFPDFLIRSGGRWLWLLRLIAAVMIFGGIALIYVL